MVGMICGRGEFLACSETVNKWWMPGGCLEGSPSSGFRFTLCNVVKRGICYGKVCPSVCLSVTLASRIYTVQDIEIRFTPYDREMFPVS